MISQFVRHELQLKQQANFLKRLDHRLQMNELFSFARTILLTYISTLINLSLSLLPLMERHLNCIFTEARRGKNRIVESLLKIRITNRCLLARAPDKNCHFLKCLSVKWCRLRSNSIQRVALKEINMQIEKIGKRKRSYKSDFVQHIPMLRSSRSLSIRSSIVAIVKRDADVNQMSSNLLKS